MEKRTILCLCALTHSILNLLRHLTVPDRLHFLDLLITWLQERRGIMSAIAAKGLDEAEQSDN